MTITITQDEAESEAHRSGPAAPATGSARERRPDESEERSTLSEHGAIDPRRVRLFRGPREVLRCTLEGDKTVLRCRVVRAFPISEAGKWINIMDSKNKEVCLIEDAAELDAESQRLVAEELERFYRVATITRIVRLTYEYRTMFWYVETDRGPRDFVVKWSADTVSFRNPNEVLLVDIDTNRFIIPDITKLDPPSQKALSVIL